MFFHIDVFKKGQIFRFFNFIFPVWFHYNLPVHHSFCMYLYPISTSSMYVICFSMYKLLVIFWCTATRRNPQVASSYLCINTCTVQYFTSPLTNLLGQILAVFELTALIQMYTLRFWEANKLQWFNIYFLFIFEWFIDENIKKVTLDTTH